MAKKTYEELLEIIELQRNQIDQLKKRVEFLEKELRKIPQ